MWQWLGRWKISWDFVVLGKVTRKRGRFVIMDSSGGDSRVVVIVEAEAHQPLTNILCRNVLRQVAHHRLYGLFGFWVEGEKGEVIPFEVGFYCKEFHHASCDDTGSGSVVTELKVFLHHIFL
jgi:hypothetical protein